MDDIIDIIDQEGNVIQKTTISQSHAHGLFHLGAVVLIVKAKDCKEILIQKRSLSMPTNPGKWNFTGGHVQSGKSVQEAAQGELNEEMFSGKLTTPPKIKELFTFDKFIGLCKMRITVYATVHAGPFVPDPKEVQEYKFLKTTTLFSEVNAKEYTETTRIIIDHLKKLNLKQIFQEE